MATCRSVLQDGIQSSYGRIRRIDENRARLMLEVADAVVFRLGRQSAVGWHLAPRGDSQDMHDSNPPATFGYVGAS